MRPTDCGAGRHGIWYGCKLIGLGQYIVALSVVRENVSLHFLRHLLRCDILHAWIAALVTGLVAVYAAWSALHVYADDIVLELRDGTTVKYHVGAISTNQQQLKSGVIDEFIAAITENRTPIVTGIDGHNALAVIVTALQSAKGGKWLDIVY